MGGTMNGACAYRLAILNLIFRKISYLNQLNYEKSFHLFEPVFAPFDRVR